MFYEARHSFDLTVTFPTTASFQFYMLYTARCSSDSNWVCCITVLHQLYMCFTLPAILRAQAGLVLQLFYIGFTCVLRSPPFFGFKRGLVLQLFYIGFTCVLRKPPFFGFKRGLVLQLLYIGFTCVLCNMPAMLGKSVGHVLQLFYMGLSDFAVIRIYAGLVLRLFYIGFTCVLRTLPHSSDVGGAYFFLLFLLAFHVFYFGCYVPRMYSERASQLFYLNFARPLQTSKHASVSKNVRFTTALLFNIICFMTRQASDVSGVCFTCVLHRFDRCFTQLAILRI